MADQLPLNRLSIVDNYVESTLPVPRLSKRKHSYASLLDTIQRKIPTETLFICGYKGTGKDTLCKQLNHCEDAPEFNWVILRKPGTQYTLFKFADAQRLSFADKLKQDCHLLYGFGANWDDRKNEELTGLVNDHGMTLSEEMLHKIRSLTGSTLVRDVWVYHATMMRMYNPHHWVAEAMETLNSLDNSRPVTVTDFRFPNEVEYWERHQGPVVTCRVFRSEVPIAPQEVASEHSLDEYETDLVLIPKENFYVELNALLERFPFYENYTAIPF